MGYEACGRTSGYELFSYSLGPHFCLKVGVFDQVYLCPRRDARAFAWSSRHPLQRAVPRASARALASERKAPRPPSANLPTPRSFVKPEFGHVIIKIRLSLYSLTLCSPPLEKVRTYRSTVVNMDGAVGGVEGDFLLAQSSFSVFRANS